MRNKTLEGPPPTCLQCTPAGMPRAFAFAWRPLSSKDKLCRELHKSRPHAVDHLSERGIAYVAIHRRGTEELPMELKCIASFHRKFKHFDSEPQILRCRVGWMAT